MQSQNPDSNDSSKKIDPLPALTEKQRIALHLNYLGYLNPAYPDFAITLFFEALSYNPELAKTYHNLGAKSLSKGKAISKTIPPAENAHLNVAISYYEKSIELCKKQNNNEILVDSYCDLAQVYHEMEKYSEVISFCTKAIEVDPNCSLAYYRRARAHRYLKNHDAAMTDDKKAISLKPDFIDSHLSITKIYTSQKKYSDAIPLLEQAIKINNKHSGVYYYLGMIYQTSNYKKSHFHLALWNLFLAVKYRPDEVEFSEPFNTLLKTKDHSTILECINQLSKEQALELVSSALKEGTILQKIFSTGDNLTVWWTSKKLKDLYAELTKSRVTLRDVSYVFGSAYNQVHNPNHKKTNSVFTAQITVFSIPELARNIASQVKADDNQKELPVEISEPIFDNYYYWKLKNH